LYVSLFKIRETELLTKTPAAVFNIIMWSGIEASASTICANLPCYGPLIGRARSVSSFITNVGSFLSVGSTKHSRGASSKRKPVHAPSAPTGNITWSEASVENSLEGGAIQVAYREERHIVELERMKVRNYVNIDSQ
jgi:hypothetical protein